jgi:type IV pilus assembly protein PilW
LSRLPLRYAQLGLTLIELMISIAIGLVVVGAVSYLYIGSRGAYRGNEGLARVQEAGRFALDSITRDIRRAGALGCGSSLSVANGKPVPVNAAPAGLVVDPTTEIVGYPVAASTPPPLTSLPTNWILPTGPGSIPAYWGGDILQLQIASGAPVRVTANPDQVAGTIKIASNRMPDDSSVKNFKKLDYAVLATCSAATVIQVSSDPSVTSTALGFALSSGAIPVLSPPGTPGFSVDTYPSLQHFDQVTYYIGIIPFTTVTPPGRPALYRYSPVTGAEELVENIEDMDVVYGIGASGAITTFKHADTMVAGPNGDWPNVVSIRVSLMAVGDQLGVAPTGLTLQFRGTGANLIPAAWPAPDTRLRQVFTATAAVRDRIQ